MAQSEPTQSQQLDRKWSELLQELRVAQTGVQILTGFLLTIPFSAQFPDLDPSTRTVYLYVLCGSVLATAFLVAPVAFHRSKFYSGQRPWLLAAANHTARYGLATLAVTIGGVVWLVFSVVESTTTAFIAAGCVLLFFLLLWGLVPLIGRTDRQDAGRDGQ
ncbi:DUF6328 family protein [Ruania zhangjianzhongii]|uniref:DUF6328 family protein n=1 Tax=Ruania zhangjianzhongii TaxID=2603206 RepID=UPI0011C6EBA2|nr:DUF6328 family protein [Ruania zhangjianzhongii]